MTRSLTYDVPFEARALPKIAGHYDVTNMGGVLLSYDGGKDSSGGLGKLETGEVWSGGSGNLVRTPQGIRSTSFFQPAIFQGIANSPVEFSVTHDRSDCDVYFRYKDSGNYLVWSPDAGWIGSYVNGQRTLIIQVGAVPDVGTTTIQLDGMFITAIQRDARGNVVDIRRCADRTNLDGLGFGFGQRYSGTTFSNITLKTIQPSDSEPVGIVPDRSGKGRHLVQPVSSKRPIYVSAPNGRNWLPATDRMQGPYAGSSFGAITAFEFNSDNYGRQYNGKQAWQLRITQPGSQAFILGNVPDVPPGDYVLRFAAAGDVDHFVAFDRHSDANIPTLIPTNDFQRFEVPLHLYEAGSQIEIGFEQQIGAIWLADMSLCPAVPTPLPSGKPYLLFDGVDDSLQANDFPTGDDSSLYGVLNIRSVAGGYHAVIKKVTRDPHPIGGWQFMSNGENEMYLQTPNNRHAAAGGPTVVRAWTLVDIKWRGPVGRGVGRFAYDGVEVNDPESPGSPHQYSESLRTDGPLQIAPDAGGLSLALGEIVLLDSAPQGADDTVIRNYLRSKWGTP